MILKILVIRGKRSTTLSLLVDSRESWATEGREGRREGRTMSWARTDAAMESSPWPLLRHKTEWEAMASGGCWRWTVESDG